MCNHERRTPGGCLSFESNAVTDKTHYYYKTPGSMPLSHEAYRQGKRVFAQWNKNGLFMMPHIGCTTTYYVLHPPSFAGMIKCELYVRDVTNSVTK